MKKELSLTHCLLSAILQYDYKLEEEQGGFIIKHPDFHIFEFIPVKNKNTGTVIACGLYSADQSEYADKVLGRTLDDGWSVYASYHTHPKGGFVRAMPSSIDITKLFAGFPTNFIYAPDKELNRFDYQSVTDGWVCTNMLTFHGYTPR